MNDVAGALNGRRRLYAAGGPRGDRHVPRRKRREGPRRSAGATQLSFIPPSGGRGDAIWRPELGAARLGFPTALFAPAITISRRYPLADRRQALRAGDRRRLALDRETLIVRRIHVAIRPHQPEAASPSRRASLQSSDSSRSIAPLLRCFASAAFIGVLGACKGDASRRGCVLGHGLATT
jgi:hypothetical protein